MNENINTEAEVGLAEPVAASAAGKSRKLFAWIGAGVAAALVAGGAIAAPQIVHASQVSSYEASLEELNGVLAEIAETETAADSLVVLGALQYGEAVAFADQVSAFGSAPAHAVDAKHAEELGKAGAAAKEAIGELKLSKADEKLVASAKQMIEKADEEFKTHLPVSFLAVSASDITGLLVEPTVAVEVTPVADDVVNGDVLSEIESDLADARDELAVAVKEKVEAEKAQAVTLDAVASTLPALEAAGKSLPGTAKAATDQFTKGGEATGNLISLAEGAEKFAAAPEFSTDKEKNVVPAEKGKGNVELTESGEAVLLASKIKAYLDGVGAAQGAHEAAVAAEVAAAEQAAAEAAAASGAGGYTNPSTGAWVPVAPSGGGWTGGGGTTGGGAPAGGGTTGGGTTGGGTSAPPAGNGATLNYNPWASQPNGGCPAGTFPSGSWSNYGPGCIQNGGGGLEGLF